jgi:hypothetical protein
MANRLKAASFVVEVFLAIAIVVLPVYALQHGRPGGPGPMHYDPAKEETFTATIVEVRQATCEQRPKFAGTHLLVKTEEGELEVMLGPAEFVEKQGFAMTAGDKIEITGVKTKMAGEPAFLAREIKKGDAVLTLREKTGRPKWAGGPHHGPCWHGPS